MVIKTFLKIFLLLIAPILVFGQNQIRFKNLTIDDGLSQNTVFCIFQDSRDFIWIGTEDGLNRYDGYEFRTFKNELNNPQSLQNNQVNVIFEDSSHNLLIGTADGFSIFDRRSETFTNLNTSFNQKELLTSDFITSIIKDNQARIWVGTYDGLKLYNPSSKKFIRYSEINENSSINKVQTLYKDRSNNIWVSIGNDLKYFDPDKKKFIPLPNVLKNNKQLLKSMIRVIREDKQGNIWFGTEQAGLFFYNLEANTCKNYFHNSLTQNSLPVNVVRDIFFDNDNKVWVGTRKGLSILDPEKETFTTYNYEKANPESLTHMSVLSMMKDNAGSIWVGTYAGGINIHSIFNSNFYKIGEKIGSYGVLNNRVISSILVEENEALWVGTEGGGLNYIDRNRKVNRYFPLPNDEGRISDNIIKSLAKSANGNLWIGGFDGLYYFDVKNESFKRINIKDEKLYQGRKQIYSLLSDGDRLWIGTNGGGLVFWDGFKKFETFMTVPENPNTINGNNVIAIAKDPDGDIWIGTERGLNYYSIKDKSFTRYYHQSENRSSISSNNITSIFIDSKDRIWVGTRGGGLNLFDKKKQSFKTINEDDGIANNVIRAINEDENGNLWISSNKGVSKLSLGTSNGSDVRVKKINNYTIIDGLQSNQFLSNSTAKGQSGELFFGGINGINSFFPKRMIRNMFKPHIVFTEFLVRSKPMKVGEVDSPLKESINENRNIVLEYNQNYITFKYAALNFINSQKNMYAYKLEGFLNDEWHYVGNQRTATYTNLPAGDYLFKVKATNNDGIWSDEIASVHIMILPPFWKTWWAYLSYILVIAGLLYFYYYNSLETAKLKNQLMYEHMNRDKEQELAQNKLSFFTNISHEIITPLTLILAPLEKLINTNAGNNILQNQLILMQRNSERLIRLITQLLDFRKFEAGRMTLQATESDIVGFVKEIAAAFESYANSSNVSLKVIAENTSIPAWFDRDKFEKILYNLLSNAFKFINEGGEVIITISEIIQERKKKIIKIEVEDNGTGISEQNLPHIFNQFNHFDDTGNRLGGTGIGLAFTKDLVQLHHGDIFVESIQAKDMNAGYTKFTVIIPISLQHLGKNEIIQKDSEDISSYYDSVNPLLQTEKQKDFVIKGLQDQPLIMLIVEDNNDLLHFLQSHFNKDFEVHLAADGKDGLSKALKLIPDIIISDVMMPYFSGTVLCSELKSDSRTSHIPVILLTARTPAIFKIEGFKTGADDYITKPFNLGILEARIWNLLESRKKLRERFSREVTLKPFNVPIASPDEKFLEKVMEYIQDNISEPTLSVDELGKVVNMNRVTLYRKIKALTNQTTIEFMRNVRLDRAAQLLERNQFNVNEVAYMIGFTSVDYFRKMFKDKFGCTPTEYASQVRSKVGNR